jgi:hypothetical protein
MAGIIVEGGLSIILQAVVNKDAANEDLKLGLFQNDLTPAVGDDISDVTAATFTGYSAITLTGASWSVTLADPVLISYAQQTFSSSADQAAQTIYGYYLFRGTTLDLLGAERFSVPQVVQFNGDSIKITPRLYLRNTT